MSAREVRRGAFRATKVDVHLEGAQHEHRYLGDIVRILEASGLAGRTSRAAMFHRSEVGATRDIVTGDPAA